MTRWLIWKNDSRNTLYGEGDRKLSKEGEESRVQIICEKRKSYFNVRFIPEVEISPNNWIKLNSGEPLKSNTGNMFQLDDIENNEMVNIQLSLNHTETVTKEIVTYSAESEENED